MRIFIYICMYVYSHAKLGAKNVQRQNCGASLRKIATFCNTLQHTATHCNSLQHTVPQYTYVTWRVADAKPGTTLDVGSIVKWIAEAEPRTPDDALPLVDILRFSFFEHSIFSNRFFLYFIFHIGVPHTGWRRLIVCLKLQVMFRKRAIIWGIFCGK